MSTRRLKTNSFFWAKYSDKDSIRATETLRGRFIYTEDKHGKLVERKLSEKKFEEFLKYNTLEGKMMGYASNGGLLE